MQIEPQDIESTVVDATPYSKARAKSLTGYKFTGKFSEKKVRSSQVLRGGTRTDSTMNLLRKY